MSQTSTYPVHAHRKKKKKNTMISPLMPAGSDVYLMGSMWS
jgi:hypothetical protein